MAVAFDVASSSTLATSGTTNSWSHAGSASMTDIVVVVGCGADSATLTATVGGTSMTSLGKVHTNNSNLGFVQVFGLSNPPTGTQTIVVTSSVTITATTAMLSGAMSFLTSNGYGTPVTAFGSSATAKAIISTTTSGNMCVAGVATGTHVTSSTNTSRFINNGNGNSAASNCAGSTGASTGSAVTMQWAVTSDYWGVVAFEVIAANTSPTVTPGVANVTVAAYNVPYAPPMTPPGDTRQAQILYWYSLYGQALFPVPQPPSVGAGVFAGNGAVNVTGYGPTPVVTGQAGTANATVAGLGPSTSITAFPGVANVTVAALAPASTPIVFTTGAANVTVAGLGPLPLVTALPTTAPVNVAAYNPSVNVGGNATASPSVANVTVAGLSPVAQVTAVLPTARLTVAALDASGSMVTAFPGVANVAVMALNQAVTTTGNLTVTAGAANVTVTTGQVTATGGKIASVIEVAVSLLDPDWRMDLQEPGWVPEPVGAYWTMGAVTSQWLMGA